MNREKLSTALEGAVLSFLLSVSAVGVLATGFDLNLGNQSALTALLAAFSLLCAILFSTRRGGLLLLCLAALAAGYLWRKGEAAEQLLGLVHRISYIYDRAYHWGYLKATNGAWNAGYADLPLAILGCLTAAAVSHALCRGRDTALALLGPMLSAVLCFVVTDTVPKPGYLLLMLAGSAVLILTANVRSGDPHQGTRLTAIAAGPVLLALVLLFHFVPQSSYVNHSRELQQRILAWAQELPQLVEHAARQFTAPTQRNAQDQLDLASLGRRIESTQVVMEVTAQADGVLYLRGQDFAVYTGTVWMASPHRSEVFYPAEGTGSSVTIRTRTAHDMLYLPYYPSAPRQLAGGMAKNTDSLTEYTLLCSTLPENWREQMGEQPSGEGNIVFPVGTEERTIDQRRFLELPIATREKARQLLSGILNEGYTNTEKAEIIRAMVRTCAEYDHDPDRMGADAEDFALWFLEEADRGYCVHFASAAAVLLRSADVPARYVTGYMAQVQADRTLKLTGEHAHAWVEYYEPILDAWLVLEATPPQEEAPAPSAAPTERPTQSQRPEPKPEITVETTEPPAQTRPTEAAPPDLPASPSDQGSGLWLFLGALLVLALPVQRELRLRMRKRNADNPNAKALALWQEAELLGKLLKEAPPEELLTLAQRAKFSQHTLTEEELGQFTAYLRAARRELRRRPWYERILHRYFYAAY